MDGKERLCSPDCPGCDACDVCPVCENDPQRCDCTLLDPPDPEPGEPPARAG